MKIQNTYYPVNRKEWRRWLAKNHSSQNEIWIIYYKKHTGKPRIPYDDAVEEALCYGWIDSTVKSIDDEKYCQKFTPRNNKSNWSELNKKRVSTLLKNGKMTKFGLAKINAAKANGCWAKTNLSAKEIEIPKEFKTALDTNPSAYNFYKSLAPSYKKNYINWIDSAKKKETKLRRTNKAIGLLENKQKVVMM